MQIRFSAQDVHELFEEWESTGHQPQSTGINEQIIHFPTQMCDGWMQRSQLRPGLDMVVQDVNCKDSLSMGLEETGETELLRLAFCLNGHAKGFVDTNKKELEFQTGHFGIGFAQDDVATGSVEYTQGHMKMVAAYIEPQILNMLLGYPPDCSSRAIQRILEGKSVPFYFQTGQMPPAMSVAIQQILHCPYQGLTKRLYLESKLLELLALSLHEVREDNRSLIIDKILKPEDVECVYHARDILLQNLENPPSLVRLSRLVGINDYKLKIGFRQVFGTTVFGYLYHRRMERAQELLISRNLSITAISASVGYANLSAFSTAFKRKFGVTPNAYRSGKR
ncbi:MAG: AraC family transcriptional regulator [Cyanobacteria bacterium P01_F01_bin.150]